MNNDDVIRSIICLFAMDGKISKQEMQFLQEMRKKLGVSQDVVKATFEQAQQGKGKVYLSDDPAEMKRMFEILIRAAVADGKIDPQEHKVLNAVATKTGISKTDVEKYIKSNLKQALAAKPKPTGSKLRKPQTLICPKCGFKQKAGRVDCIRCGVVFRRLKQQEPTPLPDSGESAPKAPQRPMSWLHKTPESEQELEREQELMREKAAKVNKTFAVIGSIAGLIISVVLLWFGFSGMRIYMKDSRDKKVLSTISFQLTFQSLDNLKNERVPDEILNSLRNVLDEKYSSQEAFSRAVEQRIASLIERALWQQYRDLILKHATISNAEFDTVKLAQATILSGTCKMKSRGKYSHDYRCFVDYTFQAALSDGIEATFKKKKELVEMSWYNQRKRSEIVPVFYLAYNPKISRTMGRSYLHSFDFINSLILSVAGIVATAVSLWLLIKNIRKEFSPYERTKVKVTISRNRITFHK